MYLMYTVHFWVQFQITKKENLGRTNHNSLQFLTPLYKISNSYKNYGKINNSNYQHYNK